MLTAPLRSLTHYTVKTAQMKTALSEKVYIDRFIDIYLYYFEFKRVQLRLLTRDITYVLSERERFRPQLSCSQC